jgi:catechol 2,3-dioxygenase-like lactoylglutathione lyase family enzyme
MSGYATRGSLFRNCKLRLVAEPCGSEKVQHTVELEGIDHIALSVSDVELSARWYIDVLGFEPRHEGMWDGVPVFVGKGDTALALFPLQSPSGSESGRHRGRSSMLHFALRASRQNFTAAQEELKRRGIEFEFEDHEISHSIYFHDPDGHKIEITTYECD